MGIVNVIIDEICGDGTWAGYVTRCQRWRESWEAREAVAIERERVENEARNKTLEERVQMWKAGEIRELNAPWGNYVEIDEPNVWLRIKMGKLRLAKGLNYLRLKQRDFGNVSSLSMMVLNSSMI